jgi:sec-independent protein translocase protein TatC
VSDQIAPPSDTPDPPEELDPSKEDSPSRPVQDDKTFIEHLEELRNRIIYCLIAILLGTLVGFAFANPVLSILTRPFKQNLESAPESVARIRVDKDGTLRLVNPEQSVLNPESGTIETIIIEHTGEGDAKPRKIVVGKDLSQQFYFFSPIDPFLLRLKASLLVGLLLALPMLIRQVWLFIKPALTQKEKRAVIPITFSAMILFPLGAFFAWFFARFALLFLSQYTFPGLEARLNIFKYLNFLLTMMFALGIVFETPLVIMLLARVGIVTSRLLSKFRSHIYVGIFVLSAFLTPPDAFTMMALSLPLILLFEISIWLIKPIERRRARA